MLASEWKKKFKSFKQLWFFFRCQSIHNQTNGGKQVALMEMMYFVQQDEMKKKEKLVLF